MSETNLKSNIIRALRTDYPFGFFWRQAAGASNRSGLPDIMGIIQGQFVGIEVKEKGRYRDPYDGLSIIQEQTGKLIQRAGGIFVCTDDRQECLTDLGNLLKSKIRM